jgi:transcriptional regulator with XRE-family HTH domain
MKSDAITSRVRRTLEAEEEADRRAGSMLRLLRLASRLTVDQAALRAGLSAEEWEDHESGLMPIPVTRLAAIAATLDVSPARLLLLLTRGDSECRLS